MILGSGRVVTSDLSSLKEGYSCWVSCYSNSEQTVTNNNIVHLRKLLSIKSVRCLVLEGFMEEDGLRNFN